MATLYRNGFLAPITDLRADLNTLFKNVFEEPVNGTVKNHFAPSTDIVEKEGNYEMHLELPGMNSQDINVEVKDGALVIFGEKKIERKHAEDKYVVVQRESGHFTRSFTFPSEVDFDKIDAHYENGVLRVVVPKAEKTLPRRVEIKAK
jgi:HSP20 family protein